MSVWEFIGVLMVLAVQVIILVTFHRKVIPFIENVVATILVILGVIVGVFTWALTAGRIMEALVETGVESAATGDYCLDAPARARWSFGNIHVTEAP